MEGLTLGDHVREEGGEMGYVGLASRRRLLPSPIACVRCGHGDTFHTKPHTCTWRMNVLHLWRRCPCAGYVPPGVKLRTADQNPSLPWSTA